MDRARTDFIELISQGWWAMALRGLVAVVFGVLAFVWPAMTLWTLVFLFGAYALADGILALAHAFRAPKGSPRFGSLLFTGLISIAAGVMAFVWPRITAVSLLILIAVWAIVIGVMEIMEAIQLRKVINHEWLMILAGIVSVLFGFLLLFRPALGALALVWWIGSFAIVLGALLIACSLRVRRWGQLAHSAVGPTAA